MIDEGDLRRRLGALLALRKAGSRSTVLGAGSDDFESGRRYLGALAEGGYAVPTWPVEHGGMGLSGGEAEVVRAVLGEFEAPDMYPFLVGLGLIGPTILAHGAPDQQARWLPRIRSGEDIWCQMFSEPDAGSDLANLKTRARRRGGTWSVSGSKVWTSRAQYSQWGLLLARTDPSLPKHAGISAFGLDLSARGVEVRPMVQMNGDAHFNEVFLDAVEVPDADRIGAPGEGWRVAITCLSHERGSLAGDLGIPFGQVLALGRPLPAGAAVARDRWARTVISSKITEWAGLRALEARRSGRPPGPEDSGAKLRSNRTVIDAAALGLDLEGAAGTVGLDSPDEWQTAFLVGPSLGIRGGTDEIQRNILGERVLGLAPEPRVDKDRPFSERPDA
ncbi:MAG: acyl-CoA dehydrogenase family protein [Acidimicrobiales bacterium]